jgi:hypothetical protein
MKAIRIGDGILIDFEDGREKANVSRVIGGVVWPREGAPAYYCIFGQDMRPHTHRKRPITFLKEFESALPSDHFFEKMLIESRSTLCGVFYGFNSSKEDIHCGGFKLFDRYMASMDAHVRIHAPVIIEWETSINIIQSWKMGEVLIGVTKDTILGRQLGQMTRDSLHESQIPNFYAVNALRCLIDEVESGSSFGSWAQVTVPPDGGWA